MTGGRVANATVFATIYGISDEMHQILVPPRTPDWHDVAADCLGALAGALLLTLAVRTLGRLRPTRKSLSD